MGYQITYKLKKEELSSDFIPMFKDLNALNKDISESKVALKLYAMIPTKKEDPSEIVKTIREVNFLVRQYYLLLEDKAKHYIYDAICEDGEVYFCGWQYANGNDYEKQSTIDSTTENICLQKLIIPTADYFEDSEKFDMKLNDIESNLEIEDIVFDIIYSKFREKYYKHSDEYKYNTEQSSSQDGEGVEESKDE